jgi:hypothetical protein
MSPTKGRESGSVRHKQQGWPPRGMKMAGVGGGGRTAFQVPPAARRRQEPRGGLGYPQVQIDAILRRHSGRVCLHLSPLLAGVALASVLLALTPTGRCDDCLVAPPACRTHPSSWGDVKHSCRLVDEAEHPERIGGGLRVPRCATMAFLPEPSGATIVLPGAYACLLAVPRSSQQQRSPAERHGAAPPWQACIARRPLMDPCSALASQVTGAGLPDNTSGGI